MAKQNHCCLQQKHEDLPQGVKDHNNNCPGSRVRIGSTATDTWISSQERSIKNLPEKSTLDQAFERDQRKVGCKKMIWRLGRGALTGSPNLKILFLFFSQNFRLMTRLFTRESPSLCPQCTLNVRFTSHAISIGVQLKNWDFHWQ